VSRDLQQSIRYLLIFMIIEILRICRGDKGGCEKHIKRHLIIAALLFILPIGIWAFRNFIVQKEFILVATGGGRNFYEAFNPYEGKKYGITVIDETIRKGERISSEVSRDRFYFEEGLKSVFHKSKPELFRMILLKGLTFWSLIDWGPMGNGAAVKSGVRAAKSEVVVLMDADGQHQTDDITRLLAKMAEGYDMVVGARARDTHAGLGRRLANGFYNIFASKMTGHDVQDLTSGFRVVVREKFHYQS